MDEAERFRRNIASKSARFIQQGPANMKVHQFDSQMRPDSEFQSGHLKLLCVGNQCRLLDARRTPGVIESVSPEGFFRWRISAFEDKGEYWDVPVEHVFRYQFALDSPELPPDRIKSLEAQIEVFNQPLSIPIQPQRRSQTESQISQVEKSVLDWLTKHSGSMPSQISLDLLSSDQAQTIGNCLTGYMESSGLGEQEKRTSQIYVLNPFSGEWIKGLQITCAELGVKEFTGTIPRTRDIFSGPGNKQLRQKYIIHRLAFVRALFKSFGYRQVVLFRGMAAEGNWQVHSPRFFSSWTFSKEMAEAFLSCNERAKHSYLLKRTFLIEKLFLTYVETAAMNRQYREHEAVVIHDPDDEMLW
ncbi:MAG TPA: hypothetical protein VFE35_06845 [Candidatus Cybelea sp.]|nr:hypothetical protein [Candidatus Cybelea sp.]